MSDLLEQLKIPRYALYVHDYGAPVGFRLAGRDEPCAVAAAVVDENDLRRIVERSEQAVEPLEEQRQHGLFVEEGYDDTIDGIPQRVCLSLGRNPIVAFAI